MRNTTRYTRDKMRLLAKISQVTTNATSVSQLSLSFPNEFLKTKHQTTPHPPSQAQCKEEEKTEGKPPCH